MVFGSCVLVCWLVAVACGLLVVDSWLPLVVGKCCWWLMVVDVCLLGVCVFLIARSTFQWSVITPWPVSQICHGC